MKAERIRTSLSADAPASSSACLAAAEISPRRAGGSLRRASTVTVLPDAAGAYPVPIPGKTKVI